MFQRRALAALAGPARLQLVRVWPSQSGYSAVSGPDLRHFLRSASGKGAVVAGTPAAIPVSSANDAKSVYIELHGCQMNFADAEVVTTILSSSSYNVVTAEKQADIHLVMTCAIREGAESKVRKKLHWLSVQQVKHGRPRVVGVLGCMAERLKSRLFDEEPVVRLICGPDAYRDLPRLLADTEAGQRGANTQLSLEETYADLNPTRSIPNCPSAFVSIMRGCDNHCAFCVVPSTRGRERSTPADAVADRVARLVDQGVREVTLLGQNVNSYRDTSGPTSASADTGCRTPGFTALYSERPGGLRFPELLDRLSHRHPGCRFRFTSPHPKDFPPDLLRLIGERPNLAKQLHLPAQSGSTAVLGRMRRGYTREAYLRLVQDARAAVPGLAITSDIICGFCGETEADHVATLELLRLVRYTFVYHYPYSERDRTIAHKRLADDVPQDVKARRSAEIGRLFREIALQLNQATVGQLQLVLVEGDSRRSGDWWRGRNDQGVGVLLPKSGCVRGPGDFVLARVLAAGSHSLRAQPLSTVPGGPGGFAAALAAVSAADVHADVAAGPAVLTDVELED